MHCMEIEMCGWVWLRRQKYILDLGERLLMELRITYRLRKDIIK